MAFVSNEYRIDSLFIFKVDEITGDTNSAEIDMKYRALRCKIDSLDAASADFKKIQDHVMTSRKKGNPIEVKNVYSISRDVEHKHFTSHMENQRFVQMSPVCVLAHSTTPF